MREIHRCVYGRVMDYMWLGGGDRIDFQVSVLTHSIYTKATFAPFMQH